MTLRMAAAAGALIVVIGCGGGSTAHVTAGQAPAAAAKSYVAALNADADAIALDYQRKFICETRDRCISELGDIRVLTEKLLADVNGPAIPATYSQPAARLELAVQQFITQMDDALQVMQKPDGDYKAASSLPDVHALQIAVGGVVCWPKQPVPTEGGENAIAYHCP